MGVLVFAGRELTAPQIIALASALGISATNVKSGLTRLTAEGAIVSQGKARLRTYQPSPVQLGRIDAVRANLRPQREPWDETWILVAGYSPRGKAQKERLHALLWADGFRCANGTFFRPAWPMPWAEERGIFFSDLMEGTCFRGTIRASAMDPRRLYELSRLDEEADALSDALNEVPVPESPSKCFSALLRWSGHVVQLMGHFPQLPPELVPCPGIDRLRRAFQTFEAALAPAAREFLTQVLLATPGNMGLEMSPPHEAEEVQNVNQEA